MAPVKAKRRMNKNRIVFISVVLAATVYVVFTLVSQQFEIVAAKEALAAVESEIQSQQELAQQLEEKKQLVNTDEYIEKLAREKLGLVRPDEIIFVDALKAKAK